MIELCAIGAREIVETLKKFASSQLGIFLYAAITGAVGIVILLAFLSMIISPTGLLMILPAVIAFNGAAGGYSLADKEKKENKPYQNLRLVFLSLLLTVAGCIFITFFCPWEPIFDINRYFISAMSTLVFVYAGAWIAGKSKNLDR